ncbi:MAG: lysophospholipid acyltransferase family protein [Acidimicrobiia bacterium]|jgi:1-acyl-sn-glycerol-3-phosphate acyltransferase
MFYKFWRSLIVGLAYLLFGVQVRGKDRVPPRGVYILAPSHRSLLDIPFAATVTRRRLRFMAKKEIFAGPFWSWVFNQLGAVAVDRDGNDRAALKAIEVALHQGEPVVIFPEGTRREGPQLGPLASGAAYLALRTGVPIVPVGVGGSEHPVVRRRGIPWWSRVGVVVGEPIVVEAATGTIKRSSITALDEELRLRLQACFDEAVAWSVTRSGGQGGYSGQPGQRV